MILINLGGVYHALGDKIKAYELYKQAYGINLRSLGPDHPKMIEYKDHLSKLIPEFINSNETREGIKLRGISNEVIISIKQEIQKQVLNNVRIFSEKIIWSYRFLGVDWGIKGYLDDNYLIKQLGSLHDGKTLDETKMLIFEAICLGIMNSASKNMNCAIEFAKTYPGLIKQIIQEHPEYFVDGSIVRECIRDHQTLVSLLGENYAEHISGRGSVEARDDDPAKHSYWNEYSKVAIDELLKLRLQDSAELNSNNSNKQSRSKAGAGIDVGVGVNNDINSQSVEDIDSNQQCEQYQQHQGIGKVKVVSLNQVWNGNGDLLNQVVSELKISEEDSKLLVPLNIANKHWVGIALEKTAMGVRISYMDPEQQAVPSELKSQLLEAVRTEWSEYSTTSLNISFEELTLERQHYNNCGPEVVENFILYLTGNRFEQDKVIANHSRIWEGQLTGNHVNNSFVVGDCNAISGDKNSDSDSNSNSNMSMSLLAENVGIIDNYF